MRNLNVLTLTLISTLAACNMEQISRDASAALTEPVPYISPYAFTTNGIEIDEAEQSRYHCIGTVSGMDIHFYFSFADSGEMTAKIGSTYLEGTFDSQNASDSHLIFDLPTSTQPTNHWMNDITLNASSEIETATLRSGSFQGTVNCTLEQQAL